MSKRYIVNEEKLADYELFVTILDKDITIEEVSQKVFEDFNIEDAEVLIDAAIINGINNYRFVSAHPQGVCYVSLNSVDTQTANDILSEYPEYYRNTNYRYRIESKLFKRAVTEPYSEGVKLYSMTYM